MILFVASAKVSFQKRFKTHAQYRNPEQPFAVCKHQLFYPDLPLLCGCSRKILRSPLLQVLQLTLHGPDQGFRAAIEIIAQSASWVPDNLSKLQASISFARGAGSRDFALLEQALRQRALWIDS